jgi:hypothetical protein
MQGECRKNNAQTNELNEQAPGLSCTKANNGEDDRLQNKDGNHNENEEGEIPRAACAAGLSLFIVAPDEGKVHGIENKNDE